MGAGTRRSGSAANLNDAGAFVRQQEQKAAAQKQYEVDKRSQYESLPQSLRDKVSFEDAYVDRGPAATREAIQERRGSKRQNSGPDLSYFEDTLNTLESMKKNYDQRRSSNNTGIAFGPGRSNRGNISLARQLQNRMQR